MISVCLYQCQGCQIDKLHQHKQSVLSVPLSDFRRVFEEQNQKFAYQNVLFEKIINFPCKLSLKNKLVRGSRNAGDHEIPTDAYPML